MNNSELKNALQEEGIESVHLDDIVHDAASTQASNANNGGFDSQIEYLINTGWTHDEILSAAKQALT